MVISFGFPTDLSTPRTVRNKKKSKRKAFLDGTGGGNVALLKGPYHMFSRGIN